MFLRKEQVTARSRYLSSRVKNTFLYEEKLKYLFLKGCFIMETIKVKYKVSFGPVTGLLITSLAFAVVVNASMKAADYLEKNKLVKIGKGLNDLVKTMDDIDKRHYKGKEETE